MDLPKSPYETTMPQSWLWAVHELEQTLASRRTQRQDLTPLIAQAYRAGASLKQTLMISTSTQHGLTDEPFISIDVEVSERGGPIRAKTYGTDDMGLIHRNLRRDLPDFCYRCDLAAGWETLQPLMVRLWNETHLDEAGELQGIR